jgi:hypothetical protein
MQVLTFEMSGTAGRERTRHAIVSSAACRIPSSWNRSNSEWAVIADQSERAAENGFRPCWREGGSWL